MEANAETIYRPYVDALLSELKTRAYEPVIRYQGKTSREVSCAARFSAMRERSAHSS